MEHLSAEERACLMYLEETIEALEVQEDSGFSNDEPDWSGKTGGTKGKGMLHTIYLALVIVLQFIVHFPIVINKYCIFQTIGHSGA